MAALGCSAHRREKGGGLTTNSHAGKPHPGGDISCGGSCDPRRLVLPTQKRSATGSLRFPLWNASSPHPYHHCEAAARAMTNTAVAVTGCPVVVVVLVLFAVVALINVAVV